MFSQHIAEFSSYEFDDIASSGQLLPIVWSEPVYSTLSLHYNSSAEQAMRQLSSLIRQVPNWITDIDNLEKCAEWTAVAKSIGMTVHELDYVFKELVYYRSLYNANPRAILSAVDMVWYSSVNINPETLGMISNCACVLEYEFTQYSKKYAKTSMQVVNLIDPFMYPVIYGQTMVVAKPITCPSDAVNLKTMGSVPELLLMEGPNPDMDTFNLDTTYNNPHLDRYFYCQPWISQEVSYKYSWLPTDFVIDAEGNAEAVSYINNLHPVVHANLYPLLEQVFSQFISPLEQVLTDMHHLRTPRTKLEKYFLHEHYTQQANAYGDKTVAVKRSNLVFPEHRDINSMYRLTPKDNLETTRPHKPYSLLNTRLQAVVKMTNIVLNNNNPEYNDDCWHVSGLANEHIVAVGICFYSVKNVDKIQIQFREPIDLANSNDSCDDNGASDFSAIPLLQDANPHKTQEIGVISLVEGQCCVYPNMYQRQIVPFKRIDDSTDGHCKCIIMYFVDPYVTLPSTEIIPPQQQGWWANNALKAAGLDKAPVLVKNSILKNVDFPIPMSKAVYICADMKTEHKIINDSVSYSRFHINY